MDQAHEALRLADADPGRAAAIATEARRRARGDHATVSVAERALGLPGSDRRRSLDPIQVLDEAQPRGLDDLRGVRTPSR